MSETTSQCDSIWDDEVNDGIDGTKPKESKPLPVINNEVLCFLTHKIDPIPQDLLVKITTEFYTDEEIENVKHILHTTLVPEICNVRRHGSEKKKCDRYDFNSYFA